MALPSGTERTTDENCCMYFGLEVLFGYGWLLEVRPGLADISKMWAPIDKFLIHIWWRQIGHREEIRARYGIRGSATGDFFISWCCRSCSITQEHREIELEENNFPSE
jgi:Cys-rich protein (TIGR01571 family)